MIIRWNINILTLIRRLMVTWRNTTVDIVLNKSQRKGISQRHTYLFGLILMFWYRETHINPQRNRYIFVDPAGIELTTSRLGQLRELPVVQHVRFKPRKLCKKNTTPLTCPRLRWTTDNPSGMHRCQFQHLCVLILNCALALAIYICLVWFWCSGTGKRI